MTKEMVISSNRHETKVAILEDDQLVEIFFQRGNEYSLAGSIHKGRVTRVLPGMQSAFVDVGLERDAFLYVSDFLEEGGEDYERISPSEERPAGRPHSASGGSAAGRSAEETVTASFPQEKAAPAETQPPADGPRAEPVAGPAPVADPGDRSGRRSRRRRNRGHGFPEAKYAAPVAATQPPAPRMLTPQPPATQPPALPEPEVMILPGESLAKYRQATTVSGDPFEEDAPAATTSSEPELEAEEFFEPAAVEPGVEYGASISDDQALAETAGAGLEQGSVEDSEVSAGEREASNPDEGPPLDEDVQKESSEPRTSGPISLTAQLRDPGMRSLHRLSRRQRRRTGPEPGRGGRPDPRPPGRPERPHRHEGSQQRPDRPADPAERPSRPDRPPQPSISDMLREGQEVVVQIAKEPLGQKGARITSHIALPGRYVVYMPTLDHMGVSRKVSSEEERLRLKKILLTHRAGTSGGFIVRTAGEGKSEADIAADISSLYNLWLDIRQKAEKRGAPHLLHADLELVQRVVRDQLTEQVRAIWVDVEETYEDVVHFVERFQPSLVGRVKLYTRSAPIFDAFNVTAELQKALRPKVWLKSGGYIVINQTEALVAIDVNTGKYVGKSNRLEDTIVKTNVEAVREIARQMRLRDLGGIVVIDFIDMEERKSRQRVMQALEEAMRSDKAPYKILQFNDFGLVAITRKRVKQSLERSLCAPCPYCEGAGYVQSVQTVIGEILAEAQKISAVIEGKEAMLRVHPDVAKVLKSREHKYVEELEEILRRPVMILGDPLLHHEKFDLT